MFRYVRKFKIPFWICFFFIFFLRFQYFQLSMKVILFSFFFVAVRCRYFLPVFGVFSSALLSIYFSVRSICEMLFRTLLTVKHRFSTWCMCVCSPFIENHSVLGVREWCLRVWWNSHFSICLFSMAFHIRGRSNGSLSFLYFSIYSLALCVNPPPLLSLSLSLSCIKDACK